MEEFEYRFSMQSNKLADLIQLTEEPDISKSVVRALTLYYEILKWQTRGYKLGMVPMIDHEKCIINPNESVIFINTDSL